MCTKDQALEAYKSFEAWALTQGHCRVIKVLHSDCGGEYLSDTFNAHLVAMGMACKLTVHDIPQLNGIVECLNHMLLKRICAFVHRSGLPMSQSDYHVRSSQGSWGSGILDKITKMDFGEGSFQKGNWSHEMLCDREDDKWRLHKSSVTWN